MLIAIACFVGVLSLLLGAYWFFVLRPGDGSATNPVAAPQPDAGCRATFTDVAAERAQT